MNICETQQKGSLFPHFAAESLHKANLTSREFPPYISPDTELPASSPTWEGQRTAFLDKLSITSV